MGRTDWTLVALLFVAGLFAAAQFGKLALALDMMAVSYPDAGPRAAFAVSILGSIGILFGVTAGAIVARFGVRRVLLAAMALGAAISILQALILPFPVLMATRVVEGFAHLAIVVAAPTLIAQVSQTRDLPVVMAIWGMFFGVSLAVTGALLPLAASLSAVLWAHGIGLAVIAVILAPRLPRGVEQAAPGPGWLAQHIAIYRSPRIAAPGVVFFWHTAIFLAILTVLPGYLDWPGAKTALPLMGLAGTFAAGLLAKRYAALRVASAGFALTLALLAVLVLTPDSARIPVALILVFVIAIVPGACFAAIAELNQSAPDRAQANGALAQMGNVGTTFGPPIYVFAMLHVGDAAIPALTGVLSLAGLLTTLAFLRNLGRKSK